jgi:CHAT domain-containing protein/tetratricopeptide (TPR) repeat protein
MRRSIHLAAFLFVLALMISCPAHGQTAANSKQAGGAATAAPKVDWLVIFERANKDFADGKYVEAEKRFSQVLVAIDSGQFQAANKLPICLERLIETYQNWGRNDDALKLAIRHHQYNQKLSDLTPARQQILDDSANKLVDLYTALDRPLEARLYLEQMLKQAPNRAAANPVGTLQSRVKLARLVEAQGDKNQAAQIWKQAIVDGTAAKTILQKQMPQANQTTKKEFADCIAALAVAYEATNRLPDAIEIYQQLLATQTGRDDTVAAVQSRKTLAYIYAATGKYNQASKFFQEALDAQRQIATNTALEAEMLARMARIYSEQGNDSEAGRRWEQASYIYRELLQQAAKAGDLKAESMKWLDNLVIVERESGHYQPAIDACLRLIELRKKLFGDDHPLTSATHSDLGELYGAMGNLDLARRHLEQALAGLRGQKSADPLQLARVMNNLAVVELGAGSLNESKDLLEQALKSRLARLKGDDDRIAATYANLATVFLAKGDYARALQQLNQSIEIYRSHSDDQQALSKSLLNRALIYRGQGLFKDALADCHEALDIFQSKFGLDSPGAVPFFNTFASLCIAQRDYPAAAEQTQNAWQLCVKNHLENEPVAGATLYQKARIEYKLRDTPAAERDWNKALAIQQKAGQTLQAARTLNYLADIAAGRKDIAQAEKQYRHALEMQGSELAYPRMFFVTNCNLAEILYSQNKTNNAIQLVQNAVKVIETPRAGAIGGEAERAESFADFDKAFDLLVSWNLKLGRVEDAFAAAEQGRNRTFLDQLSLAGVDLRDTLTGPEGAKLRERERVLRSKFATLQAEARTKLAAGPADTLIKKLSETQVEYAKVLAEIHNASAYYRDRLTPGNNLKSLQLVQQKLAELDSMMLFYYAGAKESFLLVIGPSGQQPEVFPLTVPDDLAKSMSVAAGPVTRESLVSLVAQYLRDVRNRAGGRGLTGIVYSDEGVQAADEGTQFAKVLLPPEARNLVGKKPPSTVIIVPDGALCELPFEALLLDRKPATKYVLDVFPPIAYAPSANILLNLVDRAKPSGNAATALTLGNPHYSREATLQPNAQIGASTAKTVSTTKAPSSPSGNIGKSRSLSDITRAAYLGLLEGEGLPELPATAKECARIAQLCQKNKIDVLDLEADKATEGNFRKTLPGRRFVHVAAHGLVDQQNENLFGALALTPPAAPSGTEDDGFLSVNEIFNLRLADCELVALSACQTNVGPNRPLEAGSTIAQAFLAAGARRAVCSHWNVNDESTAELMGTFFENITVAPGGNNPISYAAALKKAKLDVRNASKWSSPYYWAAFVLVGPPQ